MPGGEHSRWDLKDGLGEREFQIFQSWSMLLKVKLNWFGVRELPLFGWHGEWSEWDRVLKVVKIVEGAFYVILYKFYIVFLCRVILENCLFFLIYHNETTDIVGNTLHFRNAAIGLLNKIEILVYVFELCWYDRILRYR